MEKSPEDTKKKNINEKKNKKHNKRNKNKKEENNIEQEEPKELTEEEKFKQELINYTDELKELKNIFDRKNPKKYNEDKIENYFLFEKVINFNNIKQKIKSIFKTENKDIFLFLSHLWNKCIELSKNINEKKINEKTEENSENNDSSEEEESNKTNKSKKKPLLSIFNKLLMNLNFFIPKIIKNEQEIKFKESICESIYTNIDLIKDIENGQYFLFYFTEVFDIREIFIEKFLNEHKESMTKFILDFLVLGLSIINIFNLQNIFPIEIIFKNISENNYSFSYHVYSLLSEIYIKNDPDKKYLVLDNIFKLLEEKKVIVKYNFVYELIKRDFKSDTNKKGIIKKFLSLININLDEEINKDNLDNIIYYCKIIIKNNDSFDEEEIIKTKEYICNYFNNLKENDWKDNLKKLNIFEYNDLKDFFNNESLIKYYNKFPLSKIDTLVKILKFIPEKIKNTLRLLSKKNCYNDGFKLIKMLKLEDEDDIPFEFIEEKMKLFFNYKIRTCEEENNPNTLIEYCLISQQTLDISSKKILDKYYNGNKHNLFYLYVIKELCNQASNNKYSKLSAKFKKENEQIYLSSNDIAKYKIEDHFGPITKDCIAIDPKKTRVEFIDDITRFEKVLKEYFINSQYIGIDSEWQQNLKVIDKTQVSIIQLSNYEESCVILLDMLELSKKEKFFDIFEKYFKNKIFIGFYFDKGDLEVFPQKLKNFFENGNNCIIYDLTLIEEQKFLEKGQSLKALTEKILGKSLCKIEQCSNWNLRPLSKCQIHYGALDALICVMIYKKIIEL